MPVQSILSSGTIASSMKPAALQTPHEAEKSFGAFLKDAIQDVNNQQIESDRLTQKLALGQEVDLHNVMIAAQKASIALNATMEIRNKVVEAYQEIIRMPV
ncbi:flagellar hook-basal body complex protein FliE [Sporosarcina luteola]|nr:flagellar hook-basal body complex protein FliE [Sporosarcina luteola]